MIENHLSIYPKVYNEIRGIHTDELKVTDTAWSSFFSILSSGHTIQRQEMLITFLSNTFIFNLGTKINISELEDFFVSWQLYKEEIASYISDNRCIIEDLYAKDDFHSVQTRHDGWWFVYAGQDRDPEALKLFGQRIKDKNWKDEYERHKIYLNYAYRLFECDRLPEGIKIVKKARRFLRIRFLFHHLKHKTPTKLLRRNIARVKAAWASSYMDYIRYQTNLDMYLYRAGLKKYLKPLYLKNVKGPAEKYNRMSRKATGVEYLADIANRPQQSLRIMEIAVDMWKAKPDELLVKEWWMYFCDTLKALQRGFYKNDYVLNMFIISEIYFEVYYFLTNVCGKDLIGEESTNDKNKTSNS